DQKTPPDFDNDAGHEGWSQRTESDVSALPDPARPDPVSTYVDTASSSARARASKRRGITTHAELAATAVQPTARRLVDAWRNSQPEQTRHRPQVIHQLSKVADGLLRDGADPELIRAALDEWDARADVHSPNALRWLYDDAVKTARATRTGPAPATTPAILGDSPRDQRVAEWRQARELYRAAQAAAQSAGAEPPPSTPSPEARPHDPPAHHHTRRQHRPPPFRPRL